MGENPKSRGVQHMKNKHKYKCKVPKNPRKSRLPQESNWDRYEDSVSDEHDYNVNVGTNFSSLFNAPISKAKNFQFKADINIREDVENSHMNNMNKLFNLDLNLLGLSIASVQFNERCNIPDNYFSDTKLDIMRLRAKSNDQLYQHTLLKERGYIDPLNDGTYTVRKDFVRDQGTDFLHIMKSSNDSLNEEFHDLTETDVDESDFGHQLTSVNSSRADLNSSHNISNLESNLGKMTICTRNSQNDKPPCIESKIEGVTCSSDYFVGTSQSNVSSMLETESLQEWLDDILGE